MFALRNPWWFTERHSLDRSRRNCSRPRLEVLEDRTLLTAGDLDPTFGVGGKVVTDFMGPVSAYGSRTAIQTDGKIVVTGYTGLGAAPRFLIARYTGDGRLDSTFGSSGQIQTDFGTSNVSLFRVAGVSIQPDGKIIVAGASDTASGAVFSVERFNSDGSVDKTFGTGGKTSAGIAYRDVAYGLALQNDGKILVVGSSFSATAVGGVGVVRFNADGSLDSSFGTGGLVETSFGGGKDIPFGVVIQSDGKIVVGGTAQPISKPPVLALARYNANGTLDNSFGTGGVVTTATNGSLTTYVSIALQPDGRIMLAGGGGMPTLFPANSFLLARYNANGSVDSSFGMSGEVTTQFDSAPAAAAHNVIVQSDGKIVAVGGALVQGNTSVVAIARYNADGSLDPSFGMGGKVTTAFLGQDEADGVALQSDGKIVAVGFSSSPRGAWPTLRSRAIRSMAVWTLASVLRGKFSQSCQAPYSLRPTRLPFSLMARWW